MNQKKKKKKNQLHVNRNSSSPGGWGPHPGWLSASDRSVVTVSTVSRLLMQSSLAFFQRNCPPKNLRSHTFKFSEELPSQTIVNHHYDAPTVFLNTRLRVCELIHRGSHHCILMNNRAILSATFSIDSVTSGHCLASMWIISLIKLTLIIFNWIQFNSR